MNDRETLTRNFSSRLIRLLIQNGYTSRSASTGVKVKELAQHAGCSFEMARRYTNGTALPDPLAIKNIANWLNVEPGWLLFGSTQEEFHSTNDALTLNKQELNVLLEKIIPVYLKKEVSLLNDLSQLHDFFSDVIADFTRLHAPLNLKLKLLETSISSAVHFIPHLSKEVCLKT